MNSVYVMRRTLNIKEIEMKTIGIKIFLAAMALASSNVQAQTSPSTGEWRAVYRCYRFDNEALVVDRALTGVSGSFRSYSTQIVIKNPGIIGYFKKNKAVYSQPTYKEIVFRGLEEIGSSSLFHSDQALTQHIQIRETDGKTQIYVEVTGSGRANWLFRDCQKTADYDLFPPIQ